VYGEQGRHILIPKGSKLIGEYKSGLVNNQSRLFVIWTRVREPNGIDVMLGSEGTDELGRAGLTGETDYHFFARFGTATLMAMISAGASTIGVNPNDEYNSMASYRQNVSQALAQQANNTLNQGINIPPTINIHQGQKIVIFVNRDLDFSRVYR
jgi:type IV secretion system protein VirB10